MRLDGGYAEPELFEFLDEVGLDYAVGLPKNAVLERLAALDLLEARMRSLASGRTEHVYAAFSYAAGTWDRARRVILTAEVVQLGSDVPLDDILVHDERTADPTLAWVLSRMRFPECPECFGVFRAVERPTYEEVLNKQLEDVIRTKGRGKLEELFTSDDTWVVS